MLRKNSFKLQLLSKNILLPKSNNNDLSYVIPGKGFQNCDKSEINNLTTNTCVLSAEAALISVSEIKLPHSQWEPLPCNIRNHV